jgi:hypothetical protein
MEALERETTRPRQVRYQAALRPDICWSLHSRPPLQTSIPKTVLSLKSSRTVSKSGYCDLPRKVSPFIVEDSAFRQIHWAFGNPDCCARYAGIPPTPLSKAWNELLKADGLKAVGLDRAGAKQDRNANYQGEEFRDGERWLRRGCGPLLPAC